MLPFAAGRRSEPGRGQRPLAAGRRPGVTASSRISLIAFAGVDTSGGKSLGPRLLLPLLPLLSVSAVMVIAAYLRSSSRVDRVGRLGRGGARRDGRGDPSRRHDSRLSAAQRRRRRRDSRRARRRRSASSSPTTCSRRSCCFRSTIARSSCSPIRRVGGSRLGRACWRHGSAGRCSSPATRSRRVSLRRCGCERTDVRGRMVMQQWSR